MRPSAIKRSACSQLRFDQFDLARRGLKRWMNDTSSSDLR
jgi:hypothetical protein